MKKPLVIAGAVAAELEPLRALAADIANITFLETGVGCVAAAASTAQFLAQQEVERLLFIGSVGTVDIEKPLLSLVSASSVSLVDSNALMEKSYHPAPMVCSYNTEPVAPAAPARIYTTLAITRDNAIGELIRKECNADCENLELFGVASASVQAGINWQSLGVITNYIGPDANRQWLQHREEAATLTAKAVHQLLKSYRG